MMNIGHDLDNQPVDLKDHYHDHDHDQEQVDMQNKKHVRVLMYLI